MRNTFGNIFTLTTYGESHGDGIGGVIDGMPAGIPIDLGFVQHELDRRRPGQSNITTARQEGDRLEVLSGLFEGKTTGCPIGFLVRNTNQHSADYENVRDLFRPSHADYTYTEKYGLRDHRGGGRSSARETISRCVGGAFAKIALQQLGISVTAYTSQVGTIALGRDYHSYDLSLAEQNSVRCPDAEVAKQMEQLILEVKSQGDTIGGIITCVIQGCPAGLGEPVFGKLDAELAKAILSIGATKGIEFGAGFEAARMSGSQNNDAFRINNSGEVFTPTNNSGGILGGITDGMPIVFRAAFQPTPSISINQKTVSLSEMKNAEISVHGRHDPCVALRAVPVVEAAAACVMLDMVSVL